MGVYKIVIEYGIIIKKRRTKYVKKRNFKLIEYRWFKL